MCAVGWRRGRAAETLGEAPRSTEAGVGSARCDLQSKSRPLCFLPLLPWHSPAQGLRSIYHNIKVMMQTGPYGKERRYLWNHRSLTDIRLDGIDLRPWVRQSFPFSMYRHFYCLYFCVFSRGGWYTGRHNLPVEMCQLVEILDYHLYHGYTVTWRCCATWSRKNLLFACV